MTLSRTRLVVTALALVAGGCAATPKPLPPDRQAVAYTFTALTSAELPPGAGFEPLTPTLSAEKTLADACRLKFEDTSQSPTFAYDQSELETKDEAVLRSIAVCLTSGPLRGHEIKLVGRADLRGNEHYNQQLGARRTDSVARFLESSGVGSARIHQTSRGEHEAVGDDETMRRADRRVDIVLVAGSSSARP